jgi:NTP pyrophosphatase (non-canonical NTP hydrolase)
VGPSAALEIGVAHSLDVPVLALERPTDPALASFVVEVSSIADAIGRARAAGLRTPVAPLRDLQAYYERVAEDRGFDQESAQDTMLLLTEEVGELARAVRKSLGLARSGTEQTDAAEELADVQLYLLHLANVVGVDLATAVRDKERLNDQRYGRRAAA